jgi:hypothetical protein
MGRITVCACVFLSTAFFLGSCHDFMGQRVHGNGNVKTEDRNVNNFKNVDVSGAAKVLVSQGDHCSVRIEADDNLQQYIEVEQNGDEISIHEREGFHLVSGNNIKIYVTAPVYNRISASGAGDIIGENKITNAEPMGMHLSGAGDIKMEIEAPKLEAEISGAGSIYMKGQTKDVSLNISGTGHAHCYDLLSENTKVDVSGVGSAEVYASVRLDADVSGVGNVRYKGNASQVNQQVSGAGSVRRAD